MEDNSSPAIERLKRRIGAARGAIAPDLVLKGGRVVNVFTDRGLVDVNRFELVPLFV
jgi:adenine deaminase